MLQVVSNINSQGNLTQVLCCSCHVVVPAVDLAPHALQQYLVAILLYMLRSSYVMCAESSVIASPSTPAGWATPDSCTHSTSKAATTVLLSQPHVQGSTWWGVMNSTGPAALGLRLCAACQNVDAMEGCAEMNLPFSYLNLLLFDYEWQLGIVLSCISGCAELLWHMSGMSVAGLYHLDSISMAVVYGHDYVLVVTHLILLGVDPCHPPPCCLHVPLPVRGCRFNDELVFRR